MKKLIFANYLIWVNEFNVQLMENLADAIENGTRDQQSDALVFFPFFFFQILFQFVFSIFGDLFSHFVPSLVFGRLMN